MYKRNASTCTSHFNIIIIIIIIIIILNYNHKWFQTVCIYSQPKSPHINFHIVNGKINFDNTKFINNEIGFLELKNSNLFFQDKNLTLINSINANYKNILVSNGSLSLKKKKKYLNRR